MYQEFFGFDRRPFPTHGSPPPFVPTPATDEVLRPLLRCAREGRGIAILSGAAGTGKTATVLEIGRQLSDSLHAVYLSTSNYISRRGLLQSILFEIGVDYAGLSEQEARLHLMEFARSLFPGKDGLLLLVDEADQLTERLLEELRGLANYMHQGRPLVRLVLCGQLALEERLALPELSAFNQRVGCHVVLEDLDRTQSAEYIRNTLAACGSEVSQVFSPEAVQLIAAASDGNVRCLHHLCDHAMLLAFVAEESPVTAALVRAALDDLQGLPLNLQIPAAAPAERMTEMNSDDEMPALALDHEHDDLPAAPVTTSATDPEVATSPVTDSDAAETIVIEFGGDAEPDQPAPPERAPDSDHSESLPPVQSPAAESDSNSREFRLEDRYAELDRLSELARQQRQPSAAVFESSPHNLTERDPGAADTGRSLDVPLPDATAQRTLEDQLLAEIANMREEVRHVSSHEVPAAATGTVKDTRPRSAAADEDPEWDVIQPEPDDFETPDVVNNSVDVPQESGFEADDAALPVSEPPLPAPAVPTVETFAADDAAYEETDHISTGERPFTTDDAPRRYAFLFTRLRNRRQELAGRPGM